MGHLFAHEQLLFHPVGYWRHALAGEHYGGLGVVHMRRKYSSELWIVEILREPGKEGVYGGYGRYRIVERYRAGMEWRRVSPDVNLVCVLLNKGASYE